MTSTIGVGKLKSQIEELARIVAEIDPKYSVSYCELPYHQKLSCQVQAEFIFKVTEIRGERHESKTT